MELALPPRNPFCVVGGTQIISNWIPNGADFMVEWFCLFIGSVISLRFEEFYRTIWAQVRIPCDALICEAKCSLDPRADNC